MGARTIKNGYKLLFTVSSPSHQLPIENREIASPLSQLFNSSRFGASFLKPDLTRYFPVDLFAQASKKIPESSRLVYIAQDGGHSDSSFERCAGQGVHCAWLAFVPRRRE
jgi:hypothetical protein